MYTNLKADSQELRGRDETESRERVIWYSPSDCSGGRNSKVVVLGVNGATVHVARFEMHGRTYRNHKIFLVTSMRVNIVPLLYVTVGTMVQARD